MIKDKLIVKCIFLIILCVLTGSLLITIANYLPINEGNKATSLEQIASEGLFPEVPSMQGGYGSFHSMNPTALELATDALMLKMALYEGEGEGIEQAFRNYSTQYEEEYSRYWHGYVVVLRILTLFFNYYEIRILNAIIQNVIFALIAFYLWRDKGIKYVLALSTSYLLLMPMALAQCLQYSWAFYVAFLALLVYVKNRKYWETSNRYVYFFIVVGAAITYFDLLTYPLLSWGFLITWWIILQEKVENAFGYSKKVVGSGIAWILGYAGMWCGKWVVGSLILRENLFAKAISEALLWTVEEGENAITWKDRLSAVFINWSTYEYKIYLIILFVWVVFWCIRSVIYGLNKSLKAPALLLIASSSIVWYVILAGHAIMHHIFTHRIAGVSIAAFLGMILVSTEKKFLKENKKILNSLYENRKRILIFSSMWILICVLSYGLMLQVRDEYTRLNGGSDFVQVELHDLGIMNFTPIYSEITSFYVGVSVENGSKGTLQIELLDQGEVIDEIEMSFSEYQEGNFHEISRQWNLETNHTYELAIQPIDNDGEVYLWVSSEDTLPLQEFGTVEIDNQISSGQMLTSISYWCAPVARSSRLFYTITFVGIFMMMIYSGWSVLKKR